MGPEWQMLQDLDTFIEYIFRTVKADKYAGYLQGKDKSHRHKMFPDYKGTRPPAPDWLVANKPIVQKHLIDKWKFELVEGMEADDAVASAVEIINRQPWVNDGSPRPIAIVCSPDKDLKQVGGWIFKWSPHKKTSTLQKVTVYDSMHSVAMQLLHGDATDNIPNVRKGVGPATAEKLLEAGVVRGDHSEWETVMLEFMKEHGPYNGLLKFAENVLKVVLKRDMNFKVVLNDVPKEIKENYGLVNFTSDTSSSGSDLPETSSDNSDRDLAIS